MERGVFAADLQYFISQLDFNSVFLRNLSLFRQLSDDLVHQGLHLLVDGYENTYLSTLNADPHQYPMYRLSTSNF